jgi:ELWxxDGT repeat protein
MALRKKERSLTVRMAPLRILFFANDGLRRGLWASDGTADGTSFLKELAVSSDDLGSTEAGGLLFLVLGDLSSANSTSLWRTDGTAAGTIRLTPPEIEVSGEIRAVGATVYFTAYDEERRLDLWKSDGTAGGTVRVRNLGPGAFTGEPRHLAALHGHLFLTLSDGETRDGVLWSSDGTPQGTVPVKVIQTGGGEDNIGFVEHAGRLWFFGDDEQHGRELWSSDGTSAGTALAVELAPGPEDFNPTALLSAGGRLFVFGSSPADSGLWVSDGTAAGTQWISSTALGYPQSSAVVQGELCFVGPDDTLWRSDGTAAGTREIGQALASSPSLAALGDLLYWIDRDARLWQSDGTEPGTAPVQVPLDLSVYGPLERAGQRLFFQGRDRYSGSELWAIGPP